MTYPLQRVDWYHQVERKTRSDTDFPGEIEKGIATMGYITKTIARDLPNGDYLIGGLPAGRGPAKPPIVVLAYCSLTQ